MKSRFVKTVCFFCEEKEMKLLKQVVLLLAIMLAMAMPVSVYAAGEGNIDNGGGGMGAGTGTNFWSSHDEGVRVTVIRASDGAVVSASIDLTNKHPTDIRVHFGKVSKTSYRNGAGLSARMGGYTFIILHSPCHRSSAHQEAGRTLQPSNSTLRTSR